MNKEYVIILITEGIESYTKVIFLIIYSVFLHHKMFLISIGFAETSKDKGHNYNIKKLKRKVLSKIENLHKNNNAFIFTFSYLEKWVEKSITIMLNTAKKLKNEIIKLNLNIREHIFFKVVLWKMF